MGMKAWPLVWSEIRLDCLKDNLKAIRSWIGKPSVEILAVVKADAYGHVMLKIAQTLARQGVGFFGVANINEALELRRVCPMEKILVLGSFHPSQLPEFIRHSIRTTLSSLEDARWLEKALAKKGRARFPVHVKVDTGMGRLGVWHKESESFFRELGRFRRFAVEGVYTHFSSADGADPAVTEKQLALFERLIQKTEGLGFSPRYTHAANS